MIYVVMGTTGEYSDRNEWPVVAVETKDAAEKYVAALDRQYQSIPPAMREERWEHKGEMKAIMSLDPEFSCDYTGTRYFITEVKMLTGAELQEKLTSGEL